MRKSTIWQIIGLCLFVIGFTLIFVDAGFESYTAFFTTIKLSLISLGTFIMGTQYDKSN